VHPGFFETKEAVLSLFFRHGGPPVHREMARGGSGAASAFASLIVPALLLDRDAASLPFATVAVLSSMTMS
jgi:hypothetical protein